MYLNIYIYIHILLYIYVCTYIYIYTYMYVYVVAHVYVLGTATCLRFSESYTPQHTSIGGLMASGVSKSRTQIAIQGISYGPPALWAPFL